MEENVKVSEELINNLSIEEIAELKVEVDDMLSRLDSMITSCNEALEA